jgi:hypothetical protein
MIGKLLSGVAFMDSQADVFIPNDMAFSQSSYYDRFIQCKYKSDLSRGLFHLLIMLLDAVNSTDDSQQIWLFNTVYFQILYFGR